MLAASPAAKGLFTRAISESGGSFAPPRFGKEGGQSVAPLKVAEAAGQAFLTRIGASDIKAARALPADEIQKNTGFGTPGPGYWPILDGEVIVGDQYELYQAGRFNDTAVLIGTNSDEGALFSRGEVAPEKFESDIRSGYGERADTILAAYPHATAVEATRSTKNVARESTFAWHTWAWARLQAQKGKGKVYLYYFDYHQPHSPEGASHGDRDGIRVPQSGGAWWRSVASEGATERAGHRRLGCREQLLGQLRQDRRPERRWSARVAGLYDRRSAGDVLERKVECGRRAEPEGARGVRRLLRLAACRGDEAAPVVSACSRDPRRQQTDGGPTRRGHDEMRTAQASLLTVCALLFAVAAFAQQPGGDSLSGVTLDRKRDARRCRGR